ncbi:MAG: pantoate--beta-alanine ligase [Pirellulales bacterium]
MQVLHSPQEIFPPLEFARRNGARIGFVPTMGALHEGHLSLVRRAKLECDVAVVSIFVNPTQFAPTEDLSKYPRTLDADLALLRSVSTDYVFAPTPAKIYPTGFSTYVEPPQVALPLEGVFRPTHFRGVATVVLKLFHMIPSDVAYFGRKDYQQLAVIRKMVEDLDVPIRIIGCETVREQDGLAMSSRNRYLQPTERYQALALWRALNLAKDLANQGERRVTTLEQIMEEELRRSQIQTIDYARVVDPDSLQTLEQVTDRAVALIAARVGTTRLIDNLDLEVN